MAAALQRTLDGMRAAKCSGQCESYVVDGWDDETRRESIAFLKKQQDVEGAHFSTQRLSGDTKESEVLIFTLALRLH